MNVNSASCSLRTDDIATDKQLRTLINSHNIATVSSYHQLVLTALATAISLSISAVENQRVSGVGQTKSAPLFWRALFIQSKFYELAIDDGSG